MGKYFTQAKKEGRAMRTIVITGGPCSGKTSALTVLKEAFNFPGIALIVVDEAGTDLIMDGTSPESCGSMLAFQTKVAALQRLREADAKARALILKRVENGPKPLVVCDRGIADGAAYLSHEEYLQVLESQELQEDKIFSRYDAVFCLESAAKLSPEAYSLSNNEARSETQEEAAALDDRTYAAWKDHPHFYFIRNEENFEDKVEALMWAIVTFLQD